MATVLLGLLMAEGAVAAAKRVQIVAGEAQRFVGEEKVAVVVGVGAYPAESGLGALRYSAADARSLARALEGQGYLVVERTDGKATRELVREAIEQAGRMVKSGEGTLLFAFSGHGFSRGRANYLAAYNATLRSIERSGLDLTEVQKLMARSGARRQVLFIDACRNEVAGGGSKSPGIGTGFADFDAAKGLKILLSTGPGEFSWESDELGHGVFTHFLLQGLGGEASGRDGYVTFDALADYVQQQVKAWGFRHSQPQEPWSKGESTGQFLLGRVVVPEVSVGSGTASPRYKPELPPVLSGAPAELVAQLFLQRRDVFESDQAFVARLERGLKAFNESVRAGRKGYRAGTARLLVNEYESDAERFPLEITWQPWVKRLGLEVKAGRIRIDGAQSRQLYDSGGYQPIFVEVGRAGARPVVDKATLVGLGRNWPVVLGEQIVEPLIDQVFVKIEGGCFQMGSPLEGDADRDTDERRHRVCVEPFYLATTEVTNRQYRQFKALYDSGEYQGISLNGDDQPVVEVSWEDATAYAAWLSERTGKEYRLPTEAEWEYAARAGIEERVYWWGNEIGKNHANCDGCGSRWDDKTTAPVGSFDPNSWGLYDTAGNVYEWTCSAYGAGYEGAELRCEEGGGADRASRGGSWYSLPRFVRSAFRDRGAPSVWNNELGFRLARTF